MFSLDYCPYCKQTKQSLIGLGYQAYIVEVNHLPNQPEVREFLAGITGLKTFPKIFVGTHFVGGNDDL